MPGTVTHGFHEGSRSELLADYLFSSWGTVTPVRYSDDHGVDLYCTMTKLVGRRAIVTDYYSVQVKSEAKPWALKDRVAVRWLVEYPTPLFLARVDKKHGRLSLFQTLRRFEAQFYRQSKLEFQLGASGAGLFTPWNFRQKLPPDPPILEVALSDLLDDSKLKAFKRILQRWIELDRHNCDLRRMNVTRFRRPDSYTTNQMPSQNTVEIGQLIRPTSAAILTAVDVADCIGHQLEFSGDRKGATCAAILVRHLLRGRSASALAKDGRWPIRSTPFQQEMDQKLAAAAGRTRAYQFQELDDALQNI